MMVFDWLRGLLIFDHVLNSVGKKGGSRVAQSGLDRLLMFGLKSAAPTPSTYIIERHFEHQILHPPSTAAATALRFDASPDWPDLPTYPTLCWIDDFPSRNGLENCDRSPVRFRHHQPDNVSGRYP